MKRYVLVFFLLAAVSVKPQTVDTFFYGDTRAVLPNPYGAGYIAGTNAYLDIGKYQRIDVYAEALIRGTVIHMGFKQIVDTPDTIHIVFREMAADSSPGTLLASITATLDQFDTTNGLSFMLPNPLPMPGGPFVPVHFFIGLEWDVAVNDTFALATDVQGEGEYQNRAWEKFSDGTYQRFNQDSDFSWRLNADIWIGALYTEGLTNAEDAEAAPSVYILRQNYPNPFNPSTRIGFTLPESGEVSLKVYDLLGNTVAVLAEGFREAGSHSVQFDAKDLSGGVYFYELNAGSFRDVKKLTLIK